MSGRQPSLAAFLGGAAAASPNTFKCVHPLDNSIICSDAILLRTSNPDLSEIFHFGLLPFVKLFQDASTLLQSSNTLSNLQKSQLLLQCLVPAISSSLLSSNNHNNNNNYSNMLRANHDFNLPKMERERIFLAVAYCNMVYHSVVTDHSLLYAAMDSLELKGCMPVGEIGKVMSFHCDSALISRYFKEKFSGLKKFLEKYPNVFIFGNDHSYNPHVFLLTKLAPEHRQLVYQSVIPMEILMKYRLSKPSRKINKQLAMKTQLRGDEAEDPEQDLYFLDAVKKIPADLESFF